MIAALYACNSGVDEGRRLDEQPQQADNHEVDKDQDLNPVTLNACHRICNVSSLLLANAIGRAM